MREKKILNLIDKIPSLNDEEKKKLFERELRNIKKEQTPSKRPWWRFKK